MNYLEAGSGHTVFLLHAFPMDHRMWDAQIQALTPSCRVIAPDLPGFGGTPERQGWNLRDIATEILEIADRLDRDAFSCVGLSMGTYATFEIYRQQPERVARMVLANGRARADRPDERKARSTLAERVESEGIGVVEETMIPRLLGRSPTPDVIQTVRAAMKRASPSAITQALSALAERRDSTSLLPEIRCPVLVVAGSEDAITSVQECRDMAEAIPGATLKELPDSGHLSNIENPEGFNAALLDFLSPARSR